MPLAMDAPAVPADNRLRVGDWTVEPDLNQLSAQGRAVQVEPKAMAVLLHLADRPGGRPGSAAFARMARCRRRPGFAHASSHQAAQDAWRRSGSSDLHPDR